MIDWVAGAMDSPRALQDEIICPLCCSVFNNPRTLHCLHSYCEDCLFHFHQSKHFSDTLDCPECREVTVLEEEGIHGEQNLFWVCFVTKVKIYLCKWMWQASVLYIVSVVNTLFSLFAFVFHALYWTIHFYIIIVKIYWYNYFWVVLRACIEAVWLLLRVAMTIL